MQVLVVLLVTSLVASATALSCTDPAVMTSCRLCAMEGVSEALCCSTPAVLRVCQKVLDSKYEYARVVNNDMFPWQEEGSTEMSTETRDEPTLTSDIQKRMGGNGWYNPPSVMNQRQSDAQYRNRKRTDSKRRDRAHFTNFNRAWYKG